MNNNELHKIAPTLSKLKEKGTCFKVPKDYFSNLENCLISEINITSSLKNTNQNKFKTPEEYFKNIETSVITKLNTESFNIENNQKIPEDYFNTVEDNVIEKLNLNQKETKVISISKKIKKAFIPITIAASFVLIFTIFNKTEEITIDAIASSEIDDWIDNGLVEMDSYQLATIYNDIEIEDDFLAEVITDNELENYLNSENIEQLFLEN